ncbi:MAG: FliM/FliN family flagellar motor switch protein, partial [Candidatus Margulisbacteria bacterium]|nr:FliM/FliN family flagellar motor switch protein [Candidatus Margulisiibacteriota bacterium]
MALERQASKPEIASQKREIKLSPAIGDWTTYKPPKILVKKIKTGLYGFDRLSKDELNQVLFIHYRFVQDLLKRFKIDLGLAIEFFSVQVEQTTNLNFLRRLTGPVVQCKIKINGLHEPIFFFLELPLANSIINYSLGSIDLEPINRALTEAEINTLEATLSQYLPLFGAAFEHAITDITIAVVSSPDVTMDTTINPTSTLVSFNAELSLADNPPGKIIVAYPGSSLKGLLTKFKQIEQNKVLDFSRLPASLLSKITSPVCAQLGETNLTTNELRQFEVGDVVSLETTISSPLALSVGKELKLLCQAGIKNKKAATRIVGLRESTEIELPPPELAEKKEDKAAAKVLPAPPEKKTA